MQDLRPGHNGHRPGSVDQRIRLIQMALPDNRAYIADLLIWETRREQFLGDLARLMEDNEVKKVVHNANFDLSFIRASQERRLKPKNIFDILLASQLSETGQRISLDVAVRAKCTFGELRCHCLILWCHGNISRSN